MAGGYRRSIAAWYNLMDRIKGEYFGGMEEGVGDISQMLFEAQRPIFEDMIEQYYHGAAGLGQAVPGQGLGSKAEEGLLEDIMAAYMADITGTEMEVYSAPYLGMMGKTSPTQLFEQMHAERMGRAQAFTGASSSCCFIFLEVQDGILNAYARRYRDEYGTEEQKIGYKRLASWLVPVMKKHKIVKEIVRWTMINPLIAWGKAFYGDSKIGHIFWPVAKGWLKAFEIYGRS